MRECALDELNALRQPQMAGRALRARCNECAVCMVFLRALLLMSTPQKATRDKQKGVITGERGSRLWPVCGLCVGGVPHSRGERRSRSEIQPQIDRDPIVALRLE